MKMPPILKALLIVFAAGVASATAQETDRSTAEILADLRENNLSAEEIVRMTAPGDLTVVDLDGFAGTELMRLEEMLRTTEDGIGEIRSAIERNEKLEMSLREHDVSISELVAATRSETGDITAYIDMPLR
jgi:hypothetical protein